MPRPRKSSKEAKRTTFLLEPEEIRTLERYAVLKEADNKTEGLRILLAATKLWVERVEAGDPGVRQVKREPLRREGSTWTPTGTWCGSCGGEQFTWDDKPEWGVTCDKGHDGAEQAEQATTAPPTLTHRWINGEWLDPADDDERSIIEAADSCRKTDGMTVEDVLGNPEEDDLDDDAYDD